MTTYKVQTPGGVREIYGPEGATDEQIIAKAKELFATPGTPNTVFFDAHGNAITDPSKAIPVPPTLGEVGADVGKAVPRGTYKGVTSLAGAPGDVSQFVSEATGLPRGPSPNIPTTQDIRKSLEPITGEIGEAKTQPGKYVESVFEAAPAALGPGGPLKIAGRAAAMGVGGQLGEDIAGAPGRLVGSALGPLSPRATRWALTPMPTPEWIKPHLDVLHSHGIIPTAAQASGNKNLGYAESHLGDAFFTGSKASKQYEKNEEDLTAALLAKVRAIDPATGKPAMRGNAGTMTALFSRMGREFDRLEALSPAILTQTHLTNIGDEVSFYESISPSPISGVRKAADLIKRGISGPGGTIMDAEKYKEARSAISRMRRATPDVQAKHAFDGIQRQLDDAVESMLRITHPNEVGNWAQVRRDYRNSLVISDALASSNRGNGILDPQKMRQAVRKKDGSEAYIQGQGDFAELVRAAAEVMKPLPQSGTGPRAALTAATTLAGAGLFGLTHDPYSAIAAASFPAVAGRAVMSDTFQNWMKMQHPTASNILRQYETRPVESILRAIPATEGEAQPRAEGGPVQPGQPYVVGERGPEVVVPSQPGQVLSDIQSMPVIPGAQYAMEWQNKGQPFQQMRGESPFGGTPEGAGRPGAGAVPSTATRSGPEILSPRSASQGPADLRAQLRELDSQQRTLMQLKPMVPALVKLGVTPNQMKTMNPTQAFQLIKQSSVGGMGARDLAAEAQVDKAIEQIRAQRGEIGNRIAAGEE